MSTAINAHRVLAAVLTALIMTVSETPFGNDVGWRHVDGPGLASAVAHQLCTG